MTVIPGTSRVHYKYDIHVFIAIKFFGVVDILLTAVI